MLKKTGANFEPFHPIPLFLAVIFHIEHPHDLSFYGPEVPTKPPILCLVFPGGKRWKNEPQSTSPYKVSHCYIHHKP